jgi:hypothetical protein
VAVKLEYWLAEYLWRPQRRLCRRRRADMERQAMACREIGRGGDVSGRQLQAAQEFAVAMWFRAGAASVAILGILILSTGALSKGIRQTVAPILVVLLVLMTVCLAQTIPLVWRRRWTGSSATRGELGLRVNPREERRGQPRGRDFWIWLALGLALVWATFYGPTHWNH